MAQSSCPICYYSPLEVREVAPCFDCGWDQNELAELGQGTRQYDEVQVFGETIVLCNFCQADFRSYKPSYFNREHDVQPGKDMLYRRTVPNPKVAKDHYCPDCGQRLAFLLFLARVRSQRPLKAGATTF